MSIIENIDHPFNNRLTDQTRLTEHQIKCGRIDKRYPVRINENTIAYIKDPSKADEIKDKYLRHIYGPNYKKLLNIK